jgi:hypothetical protein
MLKPSMVQMDVLDGEKAASKRYKRVADEDWSRSD